MIFTLKVSIAYFFIARDLKDNRILPQKFMIKFYNLSYSLQSDNIIQKHEQRNAQFERKKSENFNYFESEGLNRERRSSRHFHSQGLEAVEQQDGKD